MTPWNHTFDDAGWDRHFPNRERAVEAWVSVLLDNAIRSLPSESVFRHGVSNYGKKVLYEYETQTDYPKIYPAG